VNHQAEVALLLAAPVLVGTVALAPTLVQLLYSAAFLPAAELLRWQILGDLLKIASWPLGFVLLAAGRGRAFMLTEAMGAAVLVGMTAVLLPRLGLLAPGIAYVTTYLVYLPVLYLLARRLIGFAPSRSVSAAAGLTSLAVFGTFALVTLFPMLGAGCGVLLAVGLAAFAAVRLQHALPAPLARLVSRLPGATR
jgi:PST family polysaccharide transporter